MFVIGAVINTSVPGINHIVESRDVKQLLTYARFMVDNGSKMLAINCGDRVDTEPDDIEWIFRTIQSEIAIPLCIDSPNAEAHAVGLKVHNNDFGRPMVDSITLEQKRVVEIMPLVREYDALLVALLHDECGMPQTVEDRLRVMPKLEALVTEYGVKRSDIYLDSIVYPVSVDSNTCVTYLESLTAVKKEYPGYKSICGLNNISYGLPSEDIIDMAFVSMCAARGQEAVFIEISKASSAVLSAIQSLTGRDPYCREYLLRHRSKGLDILKEDTLKSAIKCD